MGVDRRIGIREMKKKLFEFIGLEEYLSSSVIALDDQQKLQQSITTITKRNLANSSKIKHYLFY